MPQYKTGTVSVTNGSATVTGSGTLWLANVSAGDRFKVKAINTTYEIASVDSDTQITLNVNWEGATLIQQNYQINIDRTTNYDFPKIIDEDEDWQYWWTLALRDIDTKLKDVCERIETRATTTSSSTTSSTTSTTSSTTSTTSTSTTSSISTTSTTTSCTSSTSSTSSTISTTTTGP